MDTNDTLYNSRMDSASGTVVAFPINRDGEIAMSNHIDTLTVEHLRSVLNYVPETGVFTWTERPWKRSRARAGNEAGTVKLINGAKTRYIGIGGRSYTASRLAWLYVHGKWPRVRLAFSNGNTLDVAIANLSEAPSVDGEFDHGTQDGRNAYNRAHRATHPDLYRAKYLMRDFGLTFEQYAAKSAAQGHVCVICGQPETETRNGKVKRLAVDHDHQTLALRDLLCVACNTGLGKFADDPARLRAAAAYIERHRVEQTRSQPAEEAA